MRMSPVKRGIAIVSGVIGIITALFGFGVIICSFVMSAKLKGVVSPAWAGFPTLIPGILGIVIIITKNSCAIIAYLVFNIILTIVNFISCALTGLAYAIWKIAVDYLSRYNCREQSGKCFCYDKKTGNYKTSYNLGKCDDLNAVAALLLAMTMLACFAGILNFVASILGCMGLCCYKEEQPSGVVVITTEQPATVMHTSHGPPPVYNQGMPGQPDYSKQALP